MHGENLLAPQFVRPVYEYLTVESSGTQQGRIKNFRPVGCPEQHHSRFWVETIQFSQELVQRLLLFVMSTQRVRAARSPKRIQFVDKNDRRGYLAGLLEQITHPGGSDSDEHLHELRAGNRKEWDTRLPRYRARQQRLAGAGRADQQDPLGRPAAQTAIPLGILQE